jgi:hypothetical protein
MNNLFLSFLAAILVAGGLVALSRSLRMEFPTSNIFPLIPLFYAMVYELLERRKAKKDKAVHPAKAKKAMKTVMARIFENITARRIFTAIAVSLVIKIVFEIIFLILYIQSGEKSFADLYGNFGIETIGRFIKGDHPWLSGNEGFYLLSLLAVITSLGTGLWIGYTSKGKTILEGVFVGAAVTVITAVTNMLILYREIEEVANQMARSMGYGMRIGFAVVLAGQVLLYGFWAGIGQMAKLQRKKLAAIKKSVKKPHREELTSIKKSVKKSKK